MGHHVVFFTFALLFVCFIVFFYMIGAYPLYAIQIDPSISSCLSDNAAPANRQLFIHWMLPRVRLFDLAYPSRRDSRIFLVTGRCTACHESCIFMCLALDSGMP